MIKRIWTHSQTPKEATERSFWDMGTTQWEQTKAGEIKVWRIIERKIVSKEESIVEELLEPLPEQPVPLEAVYQRAGSGWQLEEQVLVKAQSVSDPVPSATPCQRANKDQTIKATKANKTSLPPQRSQVQKQGQTSRAPHQQSDANSQATQSSQESAEHSSRRIPSELWSSLSQWIPPERFYQPSLHLLANSELCEQPTPTSAHRSAQRTYSQQRPTQFQPRGRGRPANLLPSQQRNVFQRSKDQHSKPIPSLV